MAITRTLILNVVLLCLPPIIVLGVFKFFFVRHIRWAAGVVVLIDVAVFQTQLFYYESIWLALFFLVIQLEITGLLSVWLSKNTVKNKMS